MSSLLALDPGRQGFGWALFERGVLRCCGVFPQPPAPRAHQQPSIWDVSFAAANNVAFGVGKALGVAQSVLRVDEVVLEQMVAYPPPRGKKETARARTAKANDLLDLQAIGAWVAGTFRASTHWVEARSWKGGTDTDAIEERLIGRIGNPSRWTLVEGDLVAAVRPIGLRHNAVDAVAIGLVHLGRLRLV